ncbi:MAG: DUF4365 domain-containing protein [Actinobacteria bacterium]|nr:DUF4365 domain-containing protein [Actinomycetota bacterium]
MVPTSWILRQQHPDYGVDFVVQLAHSGQVSGVEFDVQLKGTSSPRYVGGKLALRMETAHLKHFAYGRSRPVAIVVVDTRNDTVLWMTASQASVSLQATCPGWERQQTVTLRFDTNQGLPESASVLEAEIIRFHDELKVATGNGCLRFKTDDFCYTMDHGFSAMQEFHIRGEIWFPNQEPGYALPYFEPIVWFGRPTGPISCGSDIRGSAQGVFEVGRLLGHGDARMAVRDLGVDPIVSYSGPSVEPGRWISFRYDFHGDSSVIEACGHVVEVTLQREIVPAPLLVIGARFAPSQGFMTADLRLLELRDTKVDETVARWTFPPVDPLLDVSHHGHDLCLHRSMRWGRRASSSDPFYVPPPGILMPSPLRRSGQPRLPDPGKGLPEEQARAARLATPGWRPPIDDAEGQTVREWLLNEWEVS